MFGVRILSGARPQQGILLDLRVRLHDLDLDLYGGPPAQIRGAPCHGWLMKPKRHPETIWSFPSV